MSELICYVNGNFVPAGSATLPVQDLAILRGYGVFDFLRTYHGQPFRLREHLHRLEQSARTIYLELPCPLEAIEAVVRDTLARNTLPEANIRIVVTGGVTSDGISPATEPGLLVLVTPPKIYPPAYYEQGIKVITVEIDRYMPTAKTINYIPAIVALNKAKAAQAVEALYVNRRQHILEGTTTNFYVFHGSQLITPIDGILPGVTREVVLGLAEQNDFKVVERALTFADVERADEAFITASNKEVMPVHQVDEITIGPHTPGPNTRKLMASFKELTWGR